MRGRQATQSSSPGLTERIRALHERIWRGNLTDMSVDLGVSYGVVGNAVRGKNSPPGVLLERLAIHPQVDVQWLFGISKGDCPPNTYQLPLPEVDVETKPGDCVEIIVSW